MSDFNTCIDTINKLLNHPDVMNVLGGKIPSIAQCKDMVVAQIKQAESDQRINITEDHIKSVITSLNIFNDIFIEVPINNNFTILMKEYALLIFNWNNEIVQDKEINRLSRTIDRLANYQLSSLETIELVKKLIYKMRNMSHYAVPGVELSRHYLESIDDRLDISKDG